MRPNFILFLLGDNGYGQHLESAAREISEALGREDVLVSSRRIKDVFIDLVIGKLNLHEAYKGFSFDRYQVGAYLGRKLRVEFHQELPQLPDHDGGSVAVSRNDNYVWRF